MLQTPASGRRLAAAALVLSLASLARALPASAAPVKALRTSSPSAATS